MRNIFIPPRGFRRGILSNASNTYELNDKLYGKFNGKLNNKFNGKLYGKFNDKLYGKFNSKFYGKPYLQLGLNKCS